MLEGRLAFISVSDGGVPKVPVASGVISAAGVAGDRQRDLRYHGGPDRAVCIYGLEVIAALRAEGHPIDVGTTGENLTISGIPWSAVAPGRELEIGDVRLRVTSYAAPCRNIAGSFERNRFSRISNETHPGWSRVYARVLTGGAVRPGDRVELVDG
jgi:MOSC domain-containing protein YiiM